MVHYDVFVKLILCDASGRRFYAHRICLLASSDAFRAMFDGGYRVSLDERITRWSCLIALILELLMY